MQKITKKFSMPLHPVVGVPAIEPDYVLLLQLLRFQSLSESKVQDVLIDWIVRWVEAKGIEIKHKKDEYGNLYITKGQADLYPCIVAHVDINQDYKEDYDILIGTKHIVGYDNVRGEQCGLGFDDKVGVYFAMVMLINSNIPNLKVFLSKDEEIGCKGTKRAKMKFFKNCSLLIQLDRRSDYNDISESTNGVDVVSEEFMLAMQELNHKYSYDWEHCVYTDVGELKRQGVECVAFNISCGYFNEHCDNEVLSKDHFVNAINYGYEIIISLGGKKWKHKSFIKDWKKKDSLVYTRDDFPTSFNSGGKAWHHTPEYRFTKLDEPYIQEQVEVGTCPVCASTLISLYEEESHCLTCESTYNIPYGKTIREVEDELWEMIYKEGKVNEGELETLK